MNKLLRHPHQQQRPRVDSLDNLSLASGVSTRTGGHSGGGRAERGGFNLRTRSGRRAAERARIEREKQEREREESAFRARVLEQAAAVMPVIEEVSEQIRLIQEQIESREAVDEETKKVFEKLDIKIAKSTEGIPEKFEMMDEKMEEMKAEMLAKVRGGTFRSFLSLSLSFCASSTFFGCFFLFFFGFIFFRFYVYALPFLWRSYPLAQKYPSTICALPHPIFFFSLIPCLNPALSLSLSLPFVLSFVSSTSSHPPPHTHKLRPAKTIGTTRGAPTHSHHQANLRLSLNRRVFSAKCRLRPSKSTNQIGTNQ